VALVLVCPSFAGAIFFGMFFAKDTRENRAKLPLACLLQIVTGAAIALWMVICYFALPYAYNAVGYLIGRSI